MTNHKKCGEIEVTLQGGLGNQLFQLAYGLELSKASGTSLRLKRKRGSAPFRLNLFGLHEDRNYILENQEIVEIDKPEHKLFCRFYRYKYHGVDYRPIDSAPDHLKINGFFQSYKYFSTISADLRASLLKSIANELDSVPKIEVCVHVRLGDYIRKLNVQKVHGNITELYLQKALNSIGKEASHEILFVTDDVESFLKYFPQYKGANFRIQSSEMLKDFSTILLSRNKIISNSTFSWWAAWLGEGKVIAPIAWYADIGMSNSANRDLLPQIWTTV